MDIVGCVKNNKLSAFLLAVIILYILKSLISSFVGIRSLSGAAPQLMTDTYGSAATGIAAPSVSSLGMEKSAIIPPQPEFAPQTDVTNRLVVQNSYLSLLVKNVTQTKNDIISYAQKAGGYMVSSNVSNPQDAPTATVTMRVPSTKLNETLDYFHSLAVKVVTENLTGQDVTDQYVDTNKRIALLEQTKAKFQEILAQAREISDITNLNQQIISIQAQIDNLKGQQEAMQKEAQLAKLTVYLSTDEIALPYAPSETWRPNVIFKLAVRSLVGNLRNLGSMIIWAGVYAVIWVPVLALFWLGWRYRNRRSTE